MLENDFEFECPYCGEGLAVRLDATAGQKQDFIHDCEVCCKPIHIRLAFEDDEVVDFSAEAED